MTMPKWFNTNLIHNILNAAIVIIPAIEALDLAPLIGQDKALVIISALGVAKILINVIRDGVTGMAKQQPPVK